MLNLIKEQDNEECIGKIYLYAKDLNEPKHQLLIKECEDAGIKHLIIQKYSTYMDDMYNNINDYNSNRKRKVLLVFDDMIADIMANKKFRAIIKELFLDAVN